MGMMAVPTTNVEGKQQCKTRRVMCASHLVSNDTPLLVEEEMYMHDNSAAL
jgi:hypothetical protein